MKLVFSGISFAPEWFLISRIGPFVTPVNYIIPSRRFLFHI
jgi:hypothetical protein